MGDADRVFFTIWQGYKDRGNIQNNTPQILFETVLAVSKLAGHVRVISVTFLETSMQMRAGIIAILGCTVVTWLLNGLYHGLIASEMMKEAYKPFEPVMKTEAEMGGPAGIFLWMIPLFVLSWFLLKILTQVPGAIAVGRGAMWGVIFSLVYCTTHEFGMYMWFKYTNIQMSVMNCGWDALTWGIGGAVLAMLYSKLYKA